MDKTDRLRDYGLAFLLYEHGLGVCGYELIRELFIFIKLILNSYLTGDHEGLADHRKELCHTKAGKGIISEDEFTPFIVLNSPVPMHYLKVMGQIDIYPTLLNLLGLEKFRWSGIGQSILDPRKPGIAISPKRKIDGDTLHISADELLRMQQSQVISDRIIRFDKLKDLR